MPLKSTLTTTITMTDLIIEINPDLIAKINYELNQYGLLPQSSSEANSFEMTDFGLVGVMGGMEDTFDIDPEYFLGFLNHYPLRDDPAEAWMQICNHLNN
jgi:hypothetical protein